MLFCHSISFSSEFATKDTSWTVDSEEKFYQLMEDFKRVCRRRKLRVNGNDIVIMKSAMGVGGRKVNVALNGELLEELKNFRYLESKITVDGGMKTSNVKEQ